VSERLAQLERVTVMHRVGDLEVRALDSVDFAVAADEAVALWGPSGSGKTTLLHVLGGLLTPTSGRALWRGVSILPIRAVAERGEAGQPVAYVFQGAKLLPTLTAYENVAFAHWARSGAGLSRRSPEELLALVGLERNLDSLPGELSGGAAQRVALARAIAQAPELLLCDEPTGQLDSDTGSRVLDLIDALRAELGFALVTATHDLGVAQRYDRVVELADGILAKHARVPV